LEELVPLKIAFVVAAGFVLTALGPSLPFGYSPYYIEFTLGYLFFLIGLLYGFQTAQDPERHHSAIACGFAFAMAVFVRPNLAIGGAVFLSMLGLLLVRQQQWRSLRGAALGVSPAFLITVHNYVFGGQLVLLTGAAFIKENLFLTPKQYASAVASKLPGLGDPANVGLVKEHLIEWLVILPGRHAFLLNLILLAVAALICVLPQQTWRVRTLFVTALSLHAGLWFWHASGRYALLAWLLTVFAVIVGAGSPLQRNFAPVRLAT
jgi:hypothetical protein